MPLDTPDEQTIRRLETLKRFISLEVQIALQCSIVTFAADHLFRGMGESFNFNPANSLPYMAIRALEERSIVHLAATLSEKELLPEGTTIRRKMDLIMHRHSLSHPLTIKWERPWMQEFFDQKREWLDIRPALVWDMQRSLNDELRRYGLTVENEDVCVTTDMAMCLELILKLSMKSASSAPSATELHGRLQTFKDAYLAFLLNNVHG